MIITSMSICLLANMFLCFALPHNLSLDSVENENIEKLRTIFNASEEPGKKNIRSIHSSLGNLEKQMLENLREKTRKGEIGGHKSKIKQKLNTNEDGEYKNESLPTIEDLPSAEIEHPYVVLVIIMKFYNYLSCSGSIITSQWVLTSAQCVISIHNLPEVYVYAGGLSMQEVIERFVYNQSFPPDAQFEAAAELIIHPEYDYELERPDIGLIKVENEFILTAAVNTIRFSITPWKGSNSDGSKTCLVSKVGNFRKSFTTNVKKPCNCHDEFVDFFGRFYADRLLCSEPTGDGDFCDGSAGAGLVCDGEIHAVAPIAVPFKNVDKCEVSKGPVPIISVCDPYNSLIAYEDTCPFVKWINSYTHVYSDDEIVECAASSHCLHFVVDFLIVLILWIW